MKKPSSVSNSTRRIEAIRAEFNRQQDRGVRSKFIIEDLAYRYFLSTQTVEAIVWKRGRYREEISTLIVA